MSLQEPALFALPRSTPVGFEAFWSIWPRKVCRVEAERAWKAAIKVAKAVTIIAGAEAYARSKEGHDITFICHASTFLRNRRWTDFSAAPMGESTERKLWRGRLHGYQPGSYWPQTWGPRPGEQGFQGPKDLLENLKCEKNSSSPEQERV